MGGGIELKKNRWFPVISMVCNTAIIIKTPQTLLCKASKEQHKKVVNSSKLNEPSSGPLSIRLNTLIILTYNDIINTSTKKIMHRVLYTFHVPSLGDSLPQFNHSSISYQGDRSPWAFSPVENCTQLSLLTSNSWNLACVRPRWYRWFCLPPKKHHETALFHTIFIAQIIKTPFCNLVLLCALQPTPDVLGSASCSQPKKSCQVFPCRPWSESLIAGPWRRNDRVLDQDSYDF